MLIDNFKEGAHEFIRSLRKSNDKIIAFSVLRSFITVGGKVIIAGMGASGKDTILNELVHTYDCFKKVTWNTTRPQRAGEVDHADYHFNGKFNRTEILYSKVFDVGGVSWNYWLDIKEWLAGNITVGTPDFIYNMSLTEERENVIVLYVDESRKVREERLLMRNDQDSVQRRLDSDDKDFAHFTDYDYVISDGMFKSKDEHLNGRML